MAPGDYYPSGPISTSTVTELYDFDSTSASTWTPFSLISANGFRGTPNRKERRTEAAKARDRRTPKKRKKRVKIR